MLSSPAMLESLHAVELDWIVQLQKLAIPEAVMMACSNLGPSKYLLGLIGFIYLCADARLGARLLSIYFTSHVLAGFAKLALHTPRPFWVDERIHAFEPGLSSYGLPSGHAVVALCVWLLLASALKRAWAWPAAGAAVLLVGLARVWLGSHFVSDVLAGYILGGVVLVAFLKCEPHCQTAWSGWKLPTKILAVTLITAGIAALDLVLWKAAAPGVAAASWAAHANSAKNIRALGGIPAAVFGLGIGLAMAGHWARFNAGGTLSQRTLRVAIVAVGGLAYWQRPRGLLKEVPDLAAAGILFVALSAAAWTFVFLLPKLFLRFGLASPETTAPAFSRQSAAH